MLWGIYESCCCNCGNSCDLVSRATEENMADAIRYGCITRRNRMENTSNYGLKRWDGEDRILVEEFNDNWDKIDTALKGNADKAAALQTALASCGNCQIGISTYTGTGTRGEEYPTVITFPKMPTVFFVRGRGTFFAAQGGASEGSLIVYDSGSAQIQDALLSWSGNQLSIVSSNNAKYQLNTDNSLYWVLALYQMDA